ncbi:hypothetical protein DdX_14162 [Ditylenchus destructor]|uniref:Uncharacterized protein n=1 Tax=Ditylenchus destructor TaxID=166010 RepID=A0AAD4QVU4_9BILA|nr:hypothetical protein DdX_14162 [Ditylenchus destructor]
MAKFIDPNFVATFLLLAAVLFQAVEARKLSKSHAQPEKTPTVDSRCTFRDMQHCVWRNSKKGLQKLLEFVKKSKIGSGDLNLEMCAGLVEEKFERIRELLKDDVKGNTAAGLGIPQTKQPLNPKPETLQTTLEKTQNAVTENVNKLVEARQLTAELFVKLSMQKQYLEVSQAHIGERGIRVPYEQWQEKMAFGPDTECIINDYACTRSDIEAVSKLFDHPDLKSAFEDAAKEPCADIDDVFDNTEKGKDVDVIIPSSDRSDITKLAEAAKKYLRKDEDHTRRRRSTTEVTVVFVACGKSHDPKETAAQRDSRNPKEIVLTMQEKAQKYFVHFVNLIAEKPEKAYVTTNQDHENRFLAKKKSYTAAALNALLYFVVKVDKPLVILLLVSLQAGLTVAALQFPPGAIAFNPLIEQISNTIKELSQDVLYPSQVPLN